MTSDVLIIGSGSAGISAAEAAREAGARSVVVVESAKRLGGECPNWGCVPSKALLRSGEVYDLAKRAKEFGVDASRVVLKLKDVRTRAGKFVDTLTGGGRLEAHLKDLGVKLFRGEAAFVDAHTVSVAGKKFAAKKIIVAVGSETFIPPIEGLRGSGYWTSDDVVTLKAIPASMIVIGGGPIGVEAAQIFAPFGTESTIVEHGAHVLAREEADVAEVVEASFRKQGIAVFAKHDVARVRKLKKGFEVVIHPVEKKKEVVLVADALLVAAGKRPPFEALKLEKAGVRMDERGMPVLNPYLQSSNPDVYFAGDAAGQMLFTHVAHEQGVVTGTNAVKGRARISDLRVVPRGTFCRPEVGSVGITTEEAKKKGIEVRVGKVPFAAVGKALVSGEREGFVKVFVDKKTGLIVGGHIVGPNAAELVHEIALAMYAGIPAKKVADMIHAYPTFAEAVGAAAYEATRS